MNEKNVADIHLFYEPAEHETAALLEIAIPRSVELLQQRWGLPVPADCRVYVMTSWAQFFFHPAKWPMKIYLGLFFPIIAYRARQVWPLAAGWTTTLGKRRVVGIKPPRLMQTADRSLGQLLFQPGLEMDDKVASTACHELTHAFTMHLRPPTWLNEGLATLAMEYYLNSRVVLPGTVHQLGALPSKYLGRGVEQMRTHNKQWFLLQYIRGYWLTRYIDETRPELLKTLLAEPRTNTALEETLAAGYGKKVGRFWKEIDKELIAYFSQPQAVASAQTTGSP
jgi:hypothetical protein